MGFSGLSFSWIKTYLTVRYQSVRIKKFFSDMFLATLGSLFANNFKVFETIYSQDDSLS